MTIAEIIRITMNSTMDHLCNKVKVPVTIHRAGKDKYGNKSY